MRVLSLFFLGFFFTSVYAHPVKIGYIDIDQVMINLPQYQQSIDELSKEFEPKKRELLTLFNNIEILRVNLNSTKSDITLQNEISKLSILEEDFTRESEYWQEAMNNKKIELLQKIEQLINITINKIAISENYDLILYENAAFVSDEVNITYKVIERIKKLSL